ncbi:MAG: hypothetical protein RMK91_07475, partial [Pseudanabaenaceae cyanobacterium SKYGB_i_bin29]|nr:hypothetical protein [Pseudanabaenaceae cyanobacterium SKYG29]MDW8421692.1 hypothetical protein [Pseudanabaenaceae cyanobacterium SKYGB_i_bin29]
MMHLTQPAVVETLSALLGELSSAQSPGASLTKLAELLEQDVTGRTIVSYLQRHIEQAGANLAYGELSNFVRGLSQALQTSPVESNNLLESVIDQAQMLEERTGIYPSAADPFDNFGAQAAEKLEELINNRRSGRDTSTVESSLEELIANYGMLRLLRYINQVGRDGGDNYETIKTYLAQGQEYLIGKTESLGELVESTIISASAADWGVEDFLVNPPSSQAADPLGALSLGAEEAEDTFIQEAGAEIEADQQAFDDLLNNLTAEPSSPEISENLLVSTSSGSDEVEIDLFGESDSPEFVIETEVMEGGETLGLGEETSETGAIVPEMTAPEMADNDDLSASSAESTPEEADQGLSELIAGAEESAVVVEQEVAGVSYPQRRGLLELGLLELVREAIGDEDATIDYDAILREEAEPLVLDEQPALDLGLEEDVTILQDVPQFFASVEESEVSASLEIGEQIITTEEPSDVFGVAAAEETPESTIDDLLTEEPAEAEVLAAAEETPEHTT